MNWISLSVFANVTATFFLKISSTTASTVSTRDARITSLVAALAAYFVAFISYRQSLVSLQVSNA